MKVDGQGGVVPTSGSLQWGWGCGVEQSDVLGACGGSILARASTGGVREGGRCVFEVYRARQYGPHRSGPGGMLEVQGSGPSCLLWDGNPLRNTLIRLTC